MLKLVNYTEDTLIFPIKYGSDVSFVTLPPDREFLKLSPPGVPSKQGFRVEDTSLSLESISAPHLKSDSWYGFMISEVVLVTTYYTRRLEECIERELRYRTDPEDDVFFIVKPSDKDKLPHRSDLVVATDYHDSALIQSILDSEEFKRRGLKQYVIVSGLENY